MDIFSTIINIGIHAHLRKTSQEKHISPQTPCGKLSKFYLFQGDQTTLTQSYNGDLLENILKLKHT